MHIDITCQLGRYLFVLGACLDMESDSANYYAVIFIWTHSNSAACLPWLGHVSRISGIRKRTAYLANNFEFATNWTQFRPDSQRQSISKTKTNIQILRTKFSYLFRYSVATQRENSFCIHALKDRIYTEPQNKTLKRNINVFRKCDYNFVKSCKIILNTL